MAACQQELDVAQYHEIEEKYRLQLVELKTTEMANSDLEKYHKVRAVLQGGMVLQLGGIAVFQRGFLLWRQMVMYRVAVPGATGIMVLHISI